MSVSTFQNPAKQNKVSILYRPDCGLAEWIIDDSHLSKRSTELCTSK